MATCLDLVRRNIEDLSQKELDEVIEQLKAKQVRGMKAGLNSDVAAVQAGRNVADRMRAAAAFVKANELRNKYIRVAALDYVMTTWEHNPGEGILALMQSSPEAQFGSRTSVDSSQNALRRRYVGHPQAELDNAGLLKTFLSGSLDLQVRKALDVIDDKAKLKAIPSQAVEIAKVLSKWYEVTRLDANRAGAMIGKLDGYAGRQSWNPDRMIRETEATWAADMAERLDFDRVFDSGLPTEKELAEWYHEGFTNLTTGVRIERGDATAERMAAFKGPGNLAKKMSMERVYHFKTPEDAHFMHEKYGVGSMAENFFHHMGHKAEQNGLLQMLGTNPKYNLDAIDKAIRANLRNDLKKLQAYDKAVDGGTRIERVYNTVSGATRFVANHTMATIDKGMRVLNTTVGLGGLGLSQITDAFYRATAMRYQGMNYFDQLAKGLVAPAAHFTSSLDSAEAKSIRASLGYHNEVQLANLIGYDLTDNVPGSLSRVATQFLKVTGAMGMTDSARLDALQAMGMHWASLSELPYEKLSTQNKRALERYAITEQEWNISREGVQKNSRGDGFLHGDGVRTIPLEKFAPLAVDRINALKAGVAERVTKRMEQDTVEREWVAKRTEKLKDGLVEAQEKLNARIARAEGEPDTVTHGKTIVTDPDSSALNAVETTRKPGQSIGDKLVAVRHQLAELYDRLDATASYWKTASNRLPSVAQTAHQAVKAERARKAISATNKASDEALQALRELKARTEVEFDAKWDKRFAALQDSIGKQSDEVMADARLAEFDQAFAEANAAITDKLKSADEASATQLGELKERLDIAQSRFSDANKEIAKAKAAAPTTGELRAYGNAEGRAKEAAKNLKAEARQLTRDLERLKKELNEDFIDRWTERSDELTAFADGVTERINQRSEINARELGSLEPQIARILDNTREEVASRWQRFYADDLDAAIPQAGARQRAKLGQGLKQGTKMAVALNQFFQFKAYAFAVFERGLQKEAKGYGSKSFEKETGSAVQGVAFLLASSLAGGYLAMQLKSLAGGKELRSNDDPRTWLAAAVQGGGLGIYGDFLFGQTSRAGGSFVATAGGPTVGKIENLYKIYQAAREGQDVGVRTANFAYRNFVPGNNFWATKLFTDYFVLYQIQNAIDPTYLQRMEQTAVENTGADWWLHPSKAAN